MSTRDRFISDIKLLLGDQMVDVELDPEHYKLAISLAVEKLRQRSDGSLEERDLFITLQPGVTEYKLPDEVQEVRRLYRRGVGASMNGGVNFDPVDAAYANMYLLQPNHSGGLATWDFYNQYLETTERVFASQINFTWHNSTKTIVILRNPKAPEDVDIRVFVSKSEESILTDPYSGFWCRQWALAVCKQMLGQARAKFASGLSGPGGTVQLNGEALLAESKEEMDKLETELYNMVASSDGYGFIIG